MKPFLLAVSSLLAVIAFLMWLTWPKPKAMVKTVREHFQSGVKRDKKKRLSFWVESPTLRVENCKSEGKYDVQFKDVMPDGCVITGMRCGPDNHLMTRAEIDYWFNVWPREAEAKLNQRNK